MTEARALRNVRLRTACDPCSTAKVRCDKKHPSCSRCSEIQSACSYSQSRRHGRQPWRKRLAHEQTRAAIGPAVAAEPGTMLGTPGLNTTPTDQIGWIASQSAPLLGAEAWGPLTSCGQNGPDDAATALPSWLPGDDFGARIGIDRFEDWDATDFSLNAHAAKNTSSDSGQSQRDAAPYLCISTEASYPPSRTATTSTHDCEARAVAILRSMQHSEVEGGLTWGSTNPAALGYPNLDLTPSFDLTPGFDRVLAVNKAALDGWSRLMKCSCAQCPHLILLYISILSKMLFWYRIAATEKLPLPGDAGSEDGGAPGSDNITIAPSPQEAPTVDRFGVRPTAVQVGMLGLDAEDQADLRRALLLRELGRTKKAVDELMNVDRTAVDENANEVVQRAVQWALTGISYIREELQAVLRKVKQTQ